MIENPGIRYFWKLKPRKRLCEILVSDEAVCIGRGVLGEDWFRELSREILNPPRTSYSILEKLRFLLDSYWARITGENVYWDD